MESPAYAAADRAVPVEVGETARPIQWAFVAGWAAATGLGWLLAHPFLHLMAFETSPLWAPVVVALAAAAACVRALARRRRGREPRWRSIAVDAGWALVVVFALALTQPGSVAGVLQWLVLRRHLPGSRGWLLASTAGALVAPLLASVVVGLDAYGYVALQGAALGLAQWLVLRRRVAAAGWWVAGSTLGWLAGGAGTVAVGAAYDQLSDYLSDSAAMVVAHTAPALVGGALCGVVSGVFLAALSRDRKALDRTHRLTVSSS